MSKNLTNTFGIGRRRVHESHPNNPVDLTAGELGGAFVSRADGMSRGKSVAFELGADSFESLNI